jgi:hypothetical protein
MNVTADRESGSKRSGLSATNESSFSGGGDFVGFARTGARNSSSLESRVSLWCG